MKLVWRIKTKIEFVHVSKRDMEVKEEKDRLEKD